MEVVVLIIALFQFLQHPTKQCRETTEICLNSISIGIFVCRGKAVNLVQVPGFCGAVQKAWD